MRGRKPNLDIDHLTNVELIRFMLYHPDEVNTKNGRYRNTRFTNALIEAKNVLPAGAMKRGLDYLIRNPSANLYFGGNDIIRPALEKALHIMEPNATMYG